MWHKREEKKNKTESWTDPFWFYLTNPIEVTLAFSLSTTPVQAFMYWRHLIACLLCTCRCVHPREQGCKIRSISRYGFVGLTTWKFWFWHFPVCWSVVEWKLLLELFTVIAPVYVTRAFFVYRHQGPPGRQGAAMMLWSSKLELTHWAPELLVDRDW